MFDKLFGSKKAEVSNADRYANFSLMQDGIVDPDADEREMRLQGDSDNQLNARLRAVNDIYASRGYTTR